MADFKHKNTDSTLMSDDDLALMQKYTEAYNKAYAEKDEAGKNAAHDAAEQLRAKYGYSGGANGNDYIKVGASGETYGGKNGGYQYDADGSIAALQNKIANREAFSYDPTTDELYSAYKKQYTREADLSAKDALGKAAVVTGGMPSTAAVAASQQARDYQMAQLTDKIPELQQLAYSMYLDDVEADYDELAMLTEAENNAYNRFTDQRDYDYGLARDAVEDARYEDETAYERQQDALTAAAKAASSSSKSATQDTGSKYTWDDVIDYEDGGGDAEDFIAAYYKDLGYSTAAQAKAAYKVYQQQNKEEEPITDVSQLSTAALNIANSMSRSYGSKASIAQRIESALENDKITRAEADYLLSLIGY